MGKLTLLALRIVLAMVLAGSLFVQAVMVPLFWQDLDEAPAGVRIPVVVREEHAQQLQSELDEVI